jgi:hypothetical protein
MEIYEDNRHLVHIKDREKYLIDNYPKGAPPKMDTKVKCLHCGSIYSVRNYKVVRIPGHHIDYISCAHAPRCNGTAIDWMPITPTRLQKDIHKVWDNYKEFFSDKIYEIKGRKVRKKVKELKHNREVTMRQYFKFIYDLYDTYVVIEELHPDYNVPDEDKLEVKAKKYGL